MEDSVREEQKRAHRGIGIMMTEEEKEIYETMHAEKDDLTSGYSTISSNKGDGGKK